MYDSSNLLDDHDVIATDRVIINVGGTRHESYISTIQNFPDTRLYWIAETALKMADFDPDRNEFFFDRHPGCFENILNYCRTGKLHCPNDVCGPLFEEELKFWGIDELMMEPCCWGNYTQHREAKKTLKLFDDIYQDSFDEEEEYQKNIHQYKNNVFLKLQHICRKIWHTLEKPGKNILSQFVTFTILSVTMLSITTYCLETMESLKKQNAIVFNHLEIFYCLFFTVDFLIRFACSPSKMKFMKSFIAWMDFLSTLQFYIATFTDFELFSILFILRLLRVFRLLHFFKNFTGILVIGQTLRASARELLTLAFILFVPMVIFSTMVYYAEQDEKNFPSIPHSFWWAIITMTTVGYGDIYPSSGYGKLLGALCAFSGILIVALPISVIGNNFNFYYSYAQARMRLPKRQYHVMIAADKGLMAMEENYDCTSDCDDDYDRATLTSRRSAIRSSGPIKKSFSGKHNKHNKKTTKNALTDLMTKEFKSSEIQHRPRTGTKYFVNLLNPVKPDVINGDTDSVRSAQSNFNESQGYKERSTTFNGDQNMLISHEMKRLTRSYNSLVADVNNRPVKPDKPERKRVVHLDITSYEPAKLDASTCALRRKNSSYNHPLRSMHSPITARNQFSDSPTKVHVDQPTNDSLKNIRKLSRMENNPQKKMSVVKRVDTETDVLMWMQEE